jgi:hypothetical protein
VRGTGVDDLLDLRPCTLRILYDLVRPEPHHAPTFTLHRSCPTGVRFDLKGVMIAVDFDHELPRYAREIRKIRANRVLTAELGVADATRSEKFPHLAFGTATVATQFTCSLAVVVVSGHNPLT